MVENEKIITENKDIIPETIKVAENKLSEEQLKDINELLEADVSIEDAKKIVTGTYKEEDNKKIDFEGKSEYEVDKEFLANDGIDLDLIKKDKIKKYQ